MELYIFDKELNFKGMVESYFSLRWVRRYSKCGEFELHCGLNTETLKLLQRGNVIWKKDDLEAGYIIYRNIKLDANGKEVLILKGKFLTGYLGERIVWSRETFDTTTELTIRQLIDKHSISPTNVDRIIPLLELGDIKNFPKTIKTQVAYKNLLDATESIATANELGYRTLIDYKNKKMVFDIYEGLNRTSGQNINSPAIFAKEFENILEQEYTDSLNNYKNTVLVAGAGEGIAREIVAIEKGTGFDRYELFVDARDLQKEKEDGTIIPPLQYTNMLLNRGESKLAEYQEIETFESKVNLNSNLIYKEDFDLGDIVTCTSKKWGVTVDTRITEIEEVYEGNGTSINIVFGNNIPTLMDKIKQVVR